MKLSILFAILSTLTGPLVFVGTAYLEGRFQSVPMYCVFALLGGGFLSAAVWMLGTASSRCKLSTPVAVSGLLAVFLAHYVFAFGLLPSAIQIWSQGVIDGIDSRIGLDKLQQWGEEALARNDRQELQLDGKCEYYGGGAPKLGAAEIPSWLMDGFYSKPEIGLRSQTSDGWIKQTHINISWYDYSLSLGKHDLAFEGTPMTLVLHRAPQPGIILTYWDVR